MPLPVALSLVNVHVRYGPRLAVDGVPGAHLFDSISWSTPRVFAQTLARAAERGVALAARDPEGPDFPRRTWEALRTLPKEART